MIALIKQLPYTILNIFNLPIKKYFKKSMYVVKERSNKETEEKFLCCSKYPKYQKIRTSEKTHHRNKM